MWSETSPTIMFDSHHSWIETLKESKLYLAVRQDRRGTLVRAPRARYERMENCLRSLGQVICLATEDLDDEALFRAFSKLKLWAVERGMSATYQDGIISSIKWLTKLCQAIFLASEIPEQEPTFEVPIVDGILLPFDGPLKFISDFYLGNRDRSLGITLEEARSLAQIGAAGRAMPYPSKEQVCSSVSATVEMITTVKPKIPNWVLRKHSFKLKSFISSLNSQKTSWENDRDLLQRTHMSLSNSASFEAPRSDGGKAGYLVALARRASDQSVTKEFLGWLKGRVDCFGKVIGDPITCILASKFLDLADDDPRKCGITVGDVAYIPSSDFAKAMQDKVDGKTSVPLQLSWLLTNTSCLDMLKYGHYDNSPSTEWNLLSFGKEFKDKLSKFHMDQDYFPVRASLSIEAGMKVRLVTSAPSAFTQISQLVANKCRETLSQDPFMRVGFQESDKLWEVLKAYGRRYDSQNSKLD
jgi:hypothetical protein